MKVTYTEWSERLQDLEEKAKLRWPDLDLHVSNQRLWVEVDSRCLTGSLDTRLGDECLVPRVSVGSSSSVSLDLSVAQSQINDMQRVMDVLHWLKASTQKIFIYPDGECPCERCGGRGTAHNSKTPCESCEGKGRR